MAPNWRRGDLDFRRPFLRVTAVFAGYADDSDRGGGHKGIRGVYASAGGFFIREVKRHPPDIGSFTNDGESPGARQQRHADGC
jgi:hypothetical protein